MGKQIMKLLILIWYSTTTIHEDPDKPHFWHCDGHDKNDNIDPVMTISVFDMTTHFCQATVMKVMPILTWSYNNHKELGSTFWYLW
jgi:hypothetical protein